MSLNEEDFRALVERLTEPVARRVTLMGQNRDRPTFRTANEELQNIFRFRGRGRGTSNRPRGSTQGRERRFTPYTPPTGKAIDVILLPTANQSTSVRGQVRANLHEEGFVVDKFYINRQWTEEEVRTRLSDAFASKLNNGSRTMSFQILKPEGQRLVVPRLAGGDQMNGSRVCDIFGQKTLYLRPESDIVTTISDEEAETSTSTSVRASSSPLPTTSWTPPTPSHQPGASASTQPFTSTSSATHSSSADDPSLVPSTSHSRACSVCTFINNSYTDTCEMCDSALTTSTGAVLTTSIGHHGVTKQTKNPVDIIQSFTSLCDFSNKPHRKLYVSREEIFTDNVTFFKKKSFHPKEGPVRVKFHGEEGVDAGGLSRENFRLFFAELRQPSKNLFFMTNQGKLLPANNQFHLFSGMYSVVGTAVGTALLNGVAVELPLSDAIVAVLLKKPHEKVCELLKKEDIIDTNLQDFITEMLDATEEDEFSSLLCSEKHPTHWLDSCGWPVAQPMTVKMKHDIALCLMFHYIIGVRRDAIDAIQKGLLVSLPQNITDADTNEFSKLLASKPISADELKTLVHNSLTDLQAKHPKENAVKFVTKLLEDMNDIEANTFAIFATGGSATSPISHLEISLSLNTLHPDELSPIANACDCTVLLPLGHQHYDVFRSTILSRMGDTGSHFLMY